LRLFRDLGFNQHGVTLRTLAGGGGDGGGGDDGGGDGGGVASEPPPLADDPLAGGLFAGVIETPEPTVSGDYRTVTTLAELDELIEAVRGAGAMAIDTETDGLSTVSARLCGLSASIEPGVAWYVPVRSPDPSAHLDTETVLARLRPVIEDETIAKIGHNLKFDLNVLRRHGVRLRGPLFDTMIASYVVDATRPSHRLGVLALALLGHRCTEFSELVGRGPRKRTFDEVPLDRAAPYAAEDADIALRLRDELGRQLDESGLRSLFDDVEMPLVEVLAELEHNGIRVDEGELRVQREKLTERTEALRREIADSAPHAFNPDSPRQLAVALFNAPDADPPGLGLKVVKRGKTGPSTDQEVLEKLAGDPDVVSPVPQLILEYRQLMKLVNTYLVALAEAIEPKTGRVHASFNQTVAATGRLSSSDPNLQNIPIRTDIGREIRRAFVADPGHVLVTADYSQIELRLLAHLSGDPALIEAFLAGMDIHRRVAAEVYGVAPEDVTRSQRDTAKMVNFGIIYGITPFGLARRLGGDVTRGQAAQIIDDYKARFTRIDSFLAECVATAHAKGYVETILGRRRAIPQVASRNPQQRALGERMAINTVVQGSAADLIKLAMIDLHRRLPGAIPEARMLLQIHDELVFETTAETALAVESLAVDRMTGAMDLAVPLVVDTAHSTSWIDAK